MKIVITGGCGYVGSKIAQRLLSTGHEILIIENFSTSVRDELKDCQIVKCDITNPKDLANLKATGYDALAANTTGTRNVGVGYSALLLNTTGSYNTAFGHLTLDANTTGTFNSAFGDPKK